MKKIPPELFSVEDQKSCTFYELKEWTRIFNICTMICAIYTPIKIIKTIKGMRRVEDVTESIDRVILELTENVEELPQFTENGREITWYDSADDLEKIIAISLI